MILGQARLKDDDFLDVVVSVLEAKARQEEIKEKDIVEAIEIGRLVRHCAASQMDEFALSIAGAETVRSLRSMRKGAGECGSLRK